MNEVDITKPVTKIRVESDPDDTVPPLIAPVVSDDKDSSGNEEEPEAVDADVSDKSGTETKGKFVLQDQMLR